MLKQSSKRYPIAAELLSLTHEQIAQLDQECTGGRGWEFYANGFVSGATVFRDTLIGQVREFTMVNIVEIKVRGREIYTSCTCSHRGGVCNHAVALLYSWTNDGESFLDVGESMDELEKLDKGDLLRIVRRILVREPKFLALALGRDAADDDDSLIEDDPLFGEDVEG
ncbi:MAG: hypothetical protein ONB14_11185 [candidate division KSB1 bacterium]|nr:hypothetical protein [candidate division KSB1 bacterium]MDZ7385413.1 hypothetical protein [candidate division KSB1 bacterium]